VEKRVGVGRSPCLVEGAPLHKVWKPLHLITLHKLVFASKLDPSALK
jgi:hypothetical protein